MLKKKMIVMRVLPGLLGTASLLAAPAAMAQAEPAPAQADPAPARQSVETGGIGEIVVTAQKRSENLQDVPISITALTAEAVDNLHATTLQGLQGAVPNVTISNFTNIPNNAVFYIRGIGVIEVDPFAGNTVSVVQNGVPQYFSYGALLDLFDVERVEVLRGPQGTLFGANTTGGVISVTTAQPTGEFGGKAEVSYGNWNRLDLKAAVDFPIVEDVLAGKVAAMHSSRDGWMTDVVSGKHTGDRSVTALRGYLKFDPSPDFTATLIGEYDKSRHGVAPQANGAVPGELGYVAPGTVFRGASLPMYQGPCVSDDLRCRAPGKYYTANGSVPDISDMDTYHVTLNMTWSGTPIGDVTAITGYKSFDLNEYGDQDTTPANLVNTHRATDGWQLSQELRTAFDVGARMNFLLGGFLMKTHYDHFMNVTLDIASPGFRQFNRQDQDNWSGSLFAQGYFDVTDRLKFQAGIRYTHEKTEMTASVYNFINLDGPALVFATDVDLQDTPLGGFDVSGSKSWDQFGWKVGLDYDLTDDALVYGYYARGFKSGGFVGRLTIPEDLGPFNPEKVDTFELGFKADWLDRRLRTNIAVFYTNYRNMQVSQSYFFENDQGVTVNGSSIFNAAKAELKGAEVEITAQPVDILTLEASAAYLDATYDDFDYVEPTGSVRSLAGKRLQNAPKWTSSVAATLNLPVGPGRLMAQARYNYSSSKYFAAITNPPRAYIQPTHYVNANLEWSPDSERWSIGLWATNLFDKRYIQSVNYAPGLYSNVGYAAPREYGASLKFNW